MRIIFCFSRFSGFFEGKGVDFVKRSSGFTVANAVSAFTQRLIKVLYALLFLWLFKMPHALIR